MPAIHRGLIAVLILLPVSTAFLLGQKQDQHDGADIRVDKKLVLVPVSVLDWKNRPVQGLDRSNFRLLDDKVDQSIESCSGADEPVTVGIVFDTSSSMQGKLRESVVAAKKFFATANPNDEFFLIEFSNSARLAVPMTVEPQRIESVLAQSKTDGKTAVLDAIHLGLAEMKKSSKHRKALLVISDGGDNHSRLSRKDIEEEVRESDVLIFAIAIYDPFNSDGLSPEEMSGPMLLKELAEETGGREFPAGYLSELDGSMTAIDRALRSIYVLGFSPANVPSSGQHSLEVRLLHPRVSAPTLSWRRWY